MVRGFRKRPERTATSRVLDALRRGWTPGRRREKVLDNRGSKTIVESMAIDQKSKPLTIHDCQRIVEADKRRRRKQQKRLQHALFGKFNTLEKRAALEAGQLFEAALEAMGVRHLALMAPKAGDKVWAWSNVSTFLVAYGPAILASPTVHYHAWYQAPGFFKFEEVGVVTDHPVSGNLFEYRKVDGEVEHGAWIYPDGLNPFFRWGKSEPVAQEWASRIALCMGQPEPLPIPENGPAKPLIVALPGQDEAREARAAEAIARAGGTAVVVPE